MFTGYSTLAWAEALPKDGHIVTCEINPETTEIAKRYFAESPHGPRSKSSLVRRSKSLKTDLGSFSISVSSTPTKKITALTTTVCLELVRPRGLIILDNMLRGGSVLDPRDAGTAADRRTQQTHPQRCAGGKRFVAGTGWNHAGAEALKLPIVSMARLYCSGQLLQSVLQIFRQRRSPFS